MTRGEDSVADPGLQPERTSLAWVRTASTVAAVAVLYVRAVPGPLIVTGTIASVATALSAGVILSGRRVHDRRSVDFSAGGTRPALLGNLVLTAVVTVMAISAAILVAYP
ncbi:DUF202 domain-containing protein [Rhodococcus sp. NPDC056960]|uniref:DUF202 domain-containing protein n=1 Tax=Rhodococcus sp. NPDC056960 TaxID=3345982 RepID=UPI00362F3CED